MPLRPYISANGELRKELEVASPPPDEVVIDGVKFLFDWSAFAAVSRRPRQSAGWPMISEALGVHPSQIREAMEFNARHGVTGVTYAEDGAAVIDSRGARTQLAYAWGQFDRNAGYGDPSPRGLHQQLAKEQ